jgi:hypothetical protein
VLGIIKLLFNSLGGAFYFDSLTLGCYWQNISTDLPGKTFRILVDYLTFRFALAWFDEFELF